MSPEYVVPVMVVLYGIIGEILHRKFMMITANVRTLPRKYRTGLGRVLRVAWPLFTLFFGAVLALTPSK